MNQVRASFLFEELQQRLIERKNAVNPFREDKTYWRNLYLYYLQEF